MRGSYPRRGGNPARRPSRIVLAALCLWIVSCCPAAAATLSLRTAAGDTAFYAPPGDTVVVLVDVDSDGETLTGVELFVAVDRHRFRLVDALPEAGFQPASATDLLSDVFADSLIALSDSVDLVHFAQVDLVGKVVNGTVMRMTMVVLAAAPGTSTIAANPDGGPGQVSLFTLAGPDGLSQAFPASSPLVFADHAPILHLPTGLTLAEDESLRVALPELVTDEAQPGDLVWAFAGPEEIVTAQVGDTLVIAGDPEFSGAGTVVFRVTDPAGSMASGAVTVTVTAVNDAPVISGAAFPDSVELSAGPVALTLRATDVDDAADALTWSAVVDAPLTSSVVDSVLTLSGPQAWSGALPVTVTVTDAGGLSASFTLVAFATADPAAPAPEDFDGSGQVDFADFIAFAAAFGRPDADARFDLDGNGTVEFADFVIFARAFGN